MGESIGTIGALGRMLFSKRPPDHPTGLYSLSSVASEGPGLQGLFVLGGPDPHPPFGHPFPGGEGCWAALSSFGRWLG